MALSHKALVTETDVVLKLNPDLRLVSRTFSDWIVYPLSGGFNFPSLVPAWAAAPLLAIEDRLAAVSRVAGFKVVAVFEKRA